MYILRDPVYPVNFIFFDPSPSGFSVAPLQKYWFIFLDPDFNFCLIFVFNLFDPNLVFFDPSPKYYYCYYYYYYYYWY